MNIQDIPLFILGIALITFGVILIIKITQDMRMHHKAIKQIHRMEQEMNATPTMQEMHEEIHAFLHRKRQ